MDTNFDRPFHDSGVQSAIEVASTNLRLDEFHLLATYGRTIRSSTINDLFWDTLIPTTIKLIKPDVCTREGKHSYTTATDHNTFNVRQHPPRLTSHKATYK